MPNSSGLDWGPRPRMGNVAAPLPTTWDCGRSPAALGLPLVSAMRLTLLLESIWKKSLSEKSSPVLKVGGIRTCKQLPRVWISVSDLKVAL